MQKLMDFSTIQKMSTQKLTKLAKNLSLLLVFFEANSLMFSKSSNQSSKSTKVNFFCNKNFEICKKLGAVFLVNQVHRVLLLEQKPAAVFFCVFVWVPSKPISLCVCVFQDWSFRK